jgi:hypothetical protein
MSKETGDKGEQIVLDYYKEKGVKVRRAEYKAGYDIKAGNKLIEVKSTNQSVKQKNFFLLSKNEFLTACQNKNYWIYWVSVKEGKIMLRINRDEILENMKPEMQYAVRLSKLKKKIKE